MADWIDNPPVIVVRVQPAIFELYRGVIGDTFTNALSLIRTDISH